MKINTIFCCLFFAIYCLSLPLSAQTLTDSWFMGKGQLCTGPMYQQDRWDEYWEGKLLRENENVGTLTTRMANWMATYGLLENLNVVVSVPYVWTRSDQGYFEGQEGFQDGTLGLKYRFMRRETSVATLRGFVVAAVSTPLSGYTPDFLPYSIGLATTNLTARVIGQAQLPNGLYLHGAAGWTVRSHAELDRGAYFDTDRMVYASTVDVPNMADFQGAIGFKQTKWWLEAQVMQMLTLGGGDIRRQDMPFVSNRMNATRLGLFLSYDLPVDGLSFKGFGGTTLQGRNMGKSDQWAVGLMYIFKSRS